MTIAVPLPRTLGRAPARRPDSRPWQIPLLGAGRKHVRLALERLLARHGYVVRDATAPPWGFRRSMDILKARGFEPCTVIDVGVGHGTPWLYEAFPHARFELFEPLDIFQTSLESICAKLDARYRLIALGREPGEGMIEVYIDVPTSSTMAGRSPLRSVVKDADGAPARVVHKSVPIRALDEFGPFRGPILLKLDAEGLESDILEGAHRTLEATDVVVSEISVGRRHERDVSIGQFIAAMEARGFRLVDMPEITSFGKSDPLSYVDGVFARRDSGLVR